MKTNKLNVLLAVTDQLRVGYKNMINDYNKFFTKSQGAFLGSKNTYTAKDGTIDDPKKRGFIPIATTVDEKIEYFIETSIKFIDSLFSQEKTNASGNAIAELFVDGKSWGVFTSLELLRLRSLLESKDLGTLNTLIMNIPVRSDSEVWNKSENEVFKNRNVYETIEVSGISKTTVKEPKILIDPNLKGKELPVNYVPAAIQIDKTVELGDYTSQRFSGEWSHTQRAHSLKRKNDIVIGVTEALKVANEIEAVESKLTAKRIFGYIFYAE